MRPEVRADYEYSRQYVNHMKVIAAKNLIGEAPFEEDAKRATDLVVLNLGTKRVACRARREQYLGRYGDEFTIRCVRDNGVETELSKVQSGWGDYLIYGFGGEDGIMSAWFLGDLYVFRKWAVEYMSANNGEYPGEMHDNRDGTHFRAFRIDDLPEEFVLDRVRAPVTA